jgi:hypothetical protein
VKRWLGLLIVFGAMTVGAVFLSRTLPIEMERRFESVRPGMTRDEVISVMGSPYKTSTTDQLYWVEWRKHDHDYFSVVLRKDGTVKRKVKHLKVTGDW